MISIPALLSTGAWAAVTIGIVVAFGRTEGGAWSIVGGVARGVRDWSRERRARRTASSSPFSGSLPPMRIPAVSAPASTRRSRRPVAPPAASVEDIAERPIH
jgi:hypothetical protein